jgi:hypothetical protein
MKKFLQTTVLVTFIFLSFNASAKSKLSIGTSMPTAMKVIIDGRKFYSQDNILNINNLQPGSHNITVYYIKNGKDFNSFYNNGNSTYWKKAVSRQVVVRNNYQYDITINRFGKAFFDQDYYSTGYFRGGDEDANNDDDENLSNYDFEDNTAYNEDYNDLDYFRKNGNSNQNVVPAFNGNNNGNYNSHNAMSGQMFNQVKQTIKQQNFESSKLDFAKQSLDKNYITTNQAKEIVDLFTMQTNKLDFAKYAYDKITDKENYFTVANSLSMQLDRDDLLKYIRNKK